MKHWIFSIILGVTLSLPVTAQHDHNKNIESIKVAFIAQKLDLTTEESQKFWPIYNNYQQELKKLIIEKNKQRKAFKQQTGPPVDELKMEAQLLELRKRYRYEFSKVLPKEKASLVYPAEREFRQQLIEQLQKRHQKN